MSRLDGARVLGLVAIRPDVPDGKLFDAWRLRPLSDPEFRALGGREATVLSDEQLVYLAGWNLIAPTSHNTVPQRFRLGPGRLELLLDRQFVLAESDAGGRQATVSLGCGVANTVLAARCHGWDTTVSVRATEAAAIGPRSASQPRHVAVADLSFRPGAGEPLSRTWLEAMLERKVQRVEFDEQVRLPPELAAEMQGRVAQHPGLRLHLLTDSPSLMFLGKFQELADTTVFNRDGFALELGEWLIPNDSPSPLGMRGREFGLGQELALRIHRGLRRELQLLPDEIAGFARVGNLGMRTSSAVAVITVDDDKAPQRLAAGQAYQELALLLLQRGFQTAVHAAIIEVDRASLALRGRLRTLHRPAVLFRIGKPLRAEDGARPHSARPALADLFLPAGA